MINERTQEVATTIYHQLGGRNFCLMTGAKHLGFGNDDGRDYLLITLPKRPEGRPNKVRIFYDAGRDLYDMEFLRVDYRTLQSETIEITNGLDVEQMRHAFERVTGLSLTLGAGQ